MAAFFTGIAISMYCPQMMGSIGNGTFLNMLNRRGDIRAYQARRHPPVATSRSPAPSRAGH